jgi:uncharacterized protein (UPF0332 family)
VSLPDELLDTARHLLRRNNNKPTDADTRRSISTAYYALFHRLIEAATARLVDGAGAQAAVGRSFDHGRMKAICLGINQSPLSKPLAPILVGPLPDELKRVTKTFVDLQQKRHEADYDRAATIKKREARDLVAQVEAAFTDWAVVQNHPVAQIFLLLLLIGEPKAR